MSTRAEVASLLMSSRLVAKVTQLLTSPAELVLALAENSEAFDSLTHAVSLLCPTIPSITLQNLFDAALSLDKRVTELEHKP